MNPFPPPPARGRILVVEVPSVFRELQALLLQRAGYEIVACDQPRLLQAFSSRSFDIVVLNCDGPSIDCAAITAAVRESWAAAAIIVIAETLTVERMHTFARNGAVVALPRPVDPQVLTERIDTLMADRGAATRATSSVD